MNITNLRTLIALSRPRFWLYICGPFLIGLAASGSSLVEIFNLKNILLILYFLFPFNFLLYGVNDFFDQKTDVLNPKKKSHEHLLQTHEKNSVLLGIYASTLLCCVLFFLIQDVGAQGWFLLLCFLGIFYSAPPLRFKARAFFDAYSNILYAIPGFMAFGLMTQQVPSLLVIIAASCWTAALHTFSAIPDISVDKKAGIETTAVFLGHKSGLVFVGINWLISAVLFSLALGPIGLVFFVYPLFIAQLLPQPQIAVEKLYWKLPLVNSFLGFAGFWYLVLR